MARRAVKDRGLSIRVACQAFRVSQSCFRYEARTSAENQEIANWLLRLTDNHRNWGFGLCFLYLRNVKCFGWNHKRVYRIYRELELNLRIKPSNGLKRERPEPLSVPDRPNQMWSMEFMSDQLWNGKSFQTLNILVDFNRKGLAIDVEFFSACRAGRSQPKPGIRVARETCIYSRRQRPIRGIIV